MCVKVWCVFIGSDKQEFGQGSLFGVNDMVCLCEDFFWFVFLEWYILFIVNSQ